MNKKILNWLKEMSQDESISNDIRIFLLGIQKGLEKEEVSNQEFLLAYREAKKEEPSQWNMLFNFGHYMGTTSVLIENINVNKENGNIDLHKEDGTQKDDAIAS